MDKIWKGSPNFWAGRQGYRPEAIVIHVMDGTLKGTDSWFASTQSGVSAHYGVGKTGEVHQYVKEEDSAWCNGIVNKPTWSLLKPGVNPNRYTIGIEHEGNASDPWPEAMIKASAELVREVCGRWGIPIDRDHIIGHYQIDGVKKPNCPGINKGMIDEIVRVARGDLGMRKDIEEGIRKVEDGLAQIRQGLNSN